MPANEFNETTIYDDQTLNFGTSKDFKFAFDSADNRLEIRDTSDTIIARLSTSGALTLAGGVVSTGNAEFAGLVRLSTAQAATIATGAITATSSYIVLDTEGAAASDDLDTINGDTAGQILVLTIANSARDVVLKNGTGNLSIGGDITIGTTNDVVMLLRRSGSNYKLIAKGIIA
jgi:hypothetical protein